MPPDDPFEPRLGKMRAQRPKVPKSFRGRVLQAAQRAGGLKRKGPGSPRSKFGRGSGAARGLATGAGKGRRVVVKARFVRLAGKGLQAAAAHLRYIQRDGVTREGAPGQMYGPQTDQADGQAFMKSAEADRHQFRFIVAPENADQYADLKPLTRRLMTAMEQDLGTRLDWVAVDHYNTGHPHTHIVVRGRTDSGQDLVIARDYLSEGFRHRAEALVSLDLGPRSDLEILQERTAEVTKARLTSIDKHLMRDANEVGLVTAAHSVPKVQALRAGRLAVLKAFGLAREIAPSVWRLRPEMEMSLRQMGQRGDIIKTIHTALLERNMGHALPDSVVHTAQTFTPITGRILKRGLADEHSDRHYLMIDATDGRVHYVDIGDGARLAGLSKDAIVELTPNRAEVKAVDRTILTIAEQSGGHYDIAAHLRFDASASIAFAETHLRRLEAIRKTTGGVERKADGRLDVGPDYLTAALKYEARLVQAAPVRIDVVSDLSLEAQTRRVGVTWLDRELVAGEADSFSGAGFGGMSRAALQQRLQWLLKEGLATEINGDIAAAPGFTDTLHRRELAAAAETIERETGLAFTETRSGQLVEGRLRGAVSLGSGKFAVVERARDFTLVPWRPVLDKHVGKEVSGIMRESGINWNIGRGRGASIDH